MAGWWEGFFDAEYLRLWGGVLSAERTASEADGIWQLLGLAAGSRVLDAPCGYGRITRVLAERGARMLGVDQSADMIQAAEQTRGASDAGALRYKRWDLRTPLDESGFDAAFNVFSSLGYGGESDDLAILKTLHAAVKPGGRVFIDTRLRDQIVAARVQGAPAGYRMPDGTLMIEEPKLDPFSGWITTAWYWSGPNGSGEKHATIRAYTATELIALARSAGLQFRSAHDGCSTRPFPDDLKAAQRTGLLFDRA